MGFPAILLLAIGLAMDATAVSAARGLALPRVERRHMLQVALWFGGAQALMPLLGWLLGAAIGPLVERYDHWIAFTLLAAIGGKMTWEALRADPADADEPLAPGDPFAPRLMLLLAIATSVDAFAVGITLPLLGAPLVLSLATIGLTTALLSVAGLHAGRRFGALLGPRLDLIGGLVLIGLGVKILVEHLSATP
ncbi:MAG: manganese efflux pump [Myxococcales bacterium]|nr:manganese efflux pump [Myxococcales bacterium]